MNGRGARAAIGATLGAVAISFVLGFIVLPLMTRDARYTGLWDAICSAAGLLRRPEPAQAIVQPALTLTQVSFATGRIVPRDPEAIGRGATLALRCTMCHGARGLSQANSPNLAGQYPAYIYKELRDFQSGARPSAVMAPLVANLLDQDLRDLAAYYAYLPRLPGYHPGPPRPQIVLSGAPMRSIAPCGACHGAIDYKLGSAWLEGQPEEYLHTQLAAFASGARHNDAGAQMRIVASHLTPEEITAAARYYASTPPP